MFKFFKRLGNSPSDKAQTPDDPYDPLTRLANAGNLFAHSEAHLSGAQVFARLVTVAPNHSLGWYGLANELFAVSGERRDMELLQASLACTRRALREDPSNQFAQHLLEVIRGRTPLAPVVFEQCEPFSGSAERLVKDAGWTSATLVEAVRQLPRWEQRLQAVMWLADQGSPEYVSLLAFAAEHDPHRDVRMGAVKRLRSHVDHPEVRPCLERIVSSGSWRDIEPYVAMTLGAIPEPWAERPHGQIRSK